MEGLTERQREVFRLIKDFIAQNGYPPTRAELAEAIGCASPNSAEEHLRALRRKGFIEMARGVSRGIRIIEQVGQ